MAMTDADRRGRAKIRELSDHSLPPSYTYLPENNIITIEYPFVHHIPDGNGGHGKARYNPDERLSRRRRPERSRRASAFWTMILIGDIILSIVPIAFVVLAFYALSLDYKPRSPAGEIVLRAEKLAPTIFPMVFAAIVGRLMRMYARWRAEYGAELGLLEQLTGSQNFLSALERAVMVQGFGLSSVLVTVLWGMSPVGGQSSLRVLGTTQAFDSHSADVAYYNLLNATTWYSQLFPSTPAVQNIVVTLNAVYQAAILSENHTDVRDPWGNVKIPYLNSLKSYPSNQSGDGWYDFDASEYKAQYTSLVGTVVGGLEDGLQADVVIPTSYLDLTCAEPEFFPIVHPGAYGGGSADAYGGFLSWLGDVSVHVPSNESAQFFVSNSGFQMGSLQCTYGWNSFMVDTNWNISDIEAPIPSSVNLIYASQGTGFGEVAAYNCTLAQTYVEVELACDGVQCDVERMRSTKNPSSITPFNQDNLGLMQSFLEWFPTSTGFKDTGSVLPADFFIAGYNRVFQQSEILNVTYRNVSGAGVAQRLGALINTAWQAGLLGPVIVQLPKPKNAEESTAMGLVNGGPTLMQTTATMTSTEEVYTASRIWIAVTVVTSLILFLCGIAGLIYKYLAKMPDILGHISTMTKDNQYFDGPLASDQLDGLERAKLLRHSMVRLCDVEPWTEDGHIVLKSVQARHRIR